IAQENSQSYVPGELPPKLPLPGGAQAILIGDFLADPAEISETIGRIGANGARGHLVMIADPVEDGFPFQGNTEFIDVDSRAPLRAGGAETFREPYLERLALHREAIGDAARGRGWSMSLHRTDGPATTALLALRGKLDPDPGTFR